MAQRYSAMLTFVIDFRYKREYLDGSRPPLRKILERDANAGAPLTLCVCGIQWHGPVRQEDGTFTEATAELEVTDGWYFVRATLDEPLTRAVRRNVIKVGRKIACAGAKVRLARALWWGVPNSCLLA